MRNQTRTLTLGTRGSLLARTQSDWVASKLSEAHPGLEIVIKVIQTTGDLNREVPFSEVGTKGMFVKEIEQSLLDGEIDFGVHSLKDMPSELPEGLEISCTPTRENPFDALLSRNGLTLDQLPPGAIVGTSSVRRQTILKHAYPHLQIQELRGNLDTRWKKLQDGRYDAIILACAGLNRLGWGDRITSELSFEIMMPAAGQGALAIENRIGDDVARELLKAIHDENSASCVAAERAFLAELGSGCSVPAGAFAQIKGARMEMHGLFYSQKANRMCVSKVEGLVSEAVELGRRSAEHCLAQSEN